MKTFAAYIVSFFFAASTLPAMAVDYDAFSTITRGDAVSPEPNPIVYNSVGNEVGVIRGMTERDGLREFIVLPT